MNDKKAALYVFTEKELRQALYDTILFYCDITDDVVEEKEVLKAVGKTISALKRGNKDEGSKGKM